MQLIISFYSFDYGLFFITNYNNNDNMFLYSN